MNIGTTERELQPSNIQEIGHLEEQGAAEASIADMSLWIDIIEKEDVPTPTGMETDGVGEVKGM